MYYCISYKYIYSPLFCQYSKIASQLALLQAFTLICDLHHSFLSPLKTFSPYFTRYQLVFSRSRLHTHSHIQFQLNGLLCSYRRRTAAHHVITTNFAHFCICSKLLDFTGTQSHRKLCVPPSQPDHVRPSIRAIP